MRRKLSGEVERGLATLRESRDLSSKISSTSQSVSALAALAALEAFYGDPVRAVFDLRELLETFQGSYDASSLGIGGLIAAIATFCRIGRPDLVARADGQLGSSPTAATDVARFEGTTYATIETADGGMFAVVPMSMGTHSGAEAALEPLTQFGFEVQRVPQCQEENPIQRTCRSWVAFVARSPTQ